MAGTPNHRPSTIFNFCEQQVTHIIDPLQNASMEVNVFIAADSADLVEWEKKWGHCLQQSGVKMVARPISSHNFSNTSFSPKQCNFTECASYFGQYTKLLDAFNVMKEYERHFGVTFDFVIKTRSDFVYKEDHFFDTKWLTQLPPNFFVSAAKEFHQINRWIDRVPRPLVIADQFVFGTRTIMEYFFDFVYNFTGKTNPGPNEGIERAFYKYMIDQSHLNVTSVDFQFGVAHVPNQTEFGWITSPCVNCFVVKS